MHPRVLYDLSLLGFCNDDPAKITGMPRVVLEQAIRLQTSPDCEATFCATEDPADAYRFIRSHPALEQARVAAWSGDTTATLDPAACESAQVFHTPHSAVPDDVRQHPKVSVIQTVYDMIPFLLPETMTAEYRELLRGHSPANLPGGSGHHDLAVGQSGFLRLYRLCGRPGPRHSSGGERGFVPALPRSGTHRGGAGQVWDSRRALPVERLHFRATQKFAARRSFVRGTASSASGTERLVPGADGRAWMDVRADPGGTRRNGSAKGTDHRHGLCAGRRSGSSLQRRTAFLYLSRYEGFGLPPLEAMQCGPR